MEYRDFNESDFVAWAGADGWSMEIDGIDHPPMIIESDTFVIIGSATGIHIYDITKEEATGYRFACIDVVDNPYIIKLIMDGLWVTINGDMGRSKIENVTELEKALRLRFT